MSDKKQKFTIGEEKDFRMGRVIFHKDLDPNAQGGGYWFYDKEKKTVYLYSTSHDFGSCTHAQIYEHRSFIKRRFRADDFVFEADPDKSLYEILCNDMDEGRATELINKNGWL